jgi:hypothetical protein
MKKIILILGGLITLTLAVLWYTDIISEPLFAVGTGIITLLSLIFIPENENKTGKTKITQNHSGKGDNVAGNKIIKK